MESEEELDEGLNKLLEMGAERLREVTEAALNHLRMYSRGVKYNPEDVAILHNRGEKTYEVLCGAVVLTVYVQTDFSVVPSQIAYDCTAHFLR